MAAQSQSVQHAGAHAWLYAHSIPEADVRCKESREMLGGEFGGLDSLLDGHSEYLAIEEELQKPLILLVATHRPECHPGAAVAESQTGRQRGSGPLARRHDVRVVGWVEVEGHHPAGQRKAESIDNLVRAKPPTGWGKRGHISGRVDGIDMHGAWSPR